MRSPRGLTLLVLLAAASTAGHGTTAHASGSKNQVFYPPKVRARMRAIMVKNPKKTYRALAELFNRDRQLAKVRTWDPGSVANTVRRYSDELPKSDAEPRFSLAARLRAREIMIANPDMDHAALAQQFEKEPLLRAVRPTWNAQGVSDMKRRFRGEFPAATPRNRIYTPAVRARMKAIQDAHPFLRADDLVPLFERDRLLAGARSTWDAGAIHQVWSEYRGEFGSRTETYTPDVRARMREVDAAHPGLTQTQLAAVYQKDPVLRKVRDEWTAPAIADVRRRFRGEFEREHDGGVPLELPLWRVVRKRVLDHLDLSYDRVAALLVEDASFARAYPGFKASTISSLVGKFDQQNEIDKARADVRDARWQRIRHELVEFPTRTYAEVAEGLNADPTFVSRFGRIKGTTIPNLQQKNEKGDALARERDRSWAEQLAARMDELPEDLSLHARFRAIGISPSKFYALRRRHQDVLGGWTADRVQRYSSAVRRRAGELALEHPSLSLEDLVPLLEADPATRQVKWTRAAVKGMWSRVPELPREAEREAALIERMLPILSAMPVGSTTDEIVQTIAAEHPRFIPETLWRLGERDARLAGALRVVTTPFAGASDRRPRPGRVDPADAAKVPFTRAQFETLLGGVSLASYIEPIRAAARNAGYNDGSFSPRTLRSLDRRTRWIMDEVYRLKAPPTGRRTLPVKERRLSLAEIEQALPRALAEIVWEKDSRSREIQSLRADVFGTALQELSDRYRREVSEGPGTATSFVARHRLSATFVKARRLFPALFPGKRVTLEQAAALYQDLMAGRLTSNSFYTRTGLDPNALRTLQVTHPAEFERIPGTPNSVALVDRSTRKIGVDEFPLLLATWNREVVTREITADDFAANHDLPFSLVYRLVKQGKLPRPPRTRAGTRATSPEIIEAVAAAARGAFADDVTLRVEDLVNVMNEDPELVSFAGRMTVARYDRMHTSSGHLFPTMRDPTIILPALAAEVRQLLADEPALTNQDIRLRLTERHRNFRNTRFDDLKHEYPELFDERTRATRAPTPERQPQGHRTVGTSRVAVEFYALAMRVAPPGTSQEGIQAVLDRMLEERGAPRVSPATMATAAVRQGYSIQEHGARVALQVLLEYASAAPEGESHEQILRRVRADYPTLGRGRIWGSYERIWRERAEELGVPRELRGKDGGLQLVGLGKKDTPRRYRGGWDVDRAVLADPELARQVARGSQFARIPMRLPMLDHLVDELKGGKPLRDHNLLMVGHMLGNTYALARALRDAGVGPSRNIVVGTPYGSPEVVVEALKDDGYDVRVPALSTRAYAAEVRRALDDAVKLYQKNRKPVLVLDDGGQVTKLLHSDPKYASVIHAFKIVEQTTRGITEAEDRSLRVSLVSVARSLSKKLEGRAVGRVVTAKLIQGLVRIGSDVKGKKVVVMGYGFIGEWIAKELRKKGANVVVVDTSPGAVRRAQRARPPFAIAEKNAALADADVVVGASGDRSLTMQHLRLLKDGAVIVSASSRQVEFDMAGLKRASRSREQLDTGSVLATMPVVRYQLGGRRVTALGDGWPINFDGDVDGLPDRDIQLTLAAMFAGALQVAKLPTRVLQNQRVLELERDQDLLALHRKLTRGQRSQPVGDPSTWKTIVRGVASRF